MEYKYKRTITLILESNHPQELNRLAYKLFRTKPVNIGEPDKYVSVTGCME